MDKNNIISEIKRLSNVLDKKYDNELDFRNHCYLRIAFDVTINEKWDNKVTKPFVKYATIIQLKNVLTLLNRYITDKDSLLTDNQKSLMFREKSKELQILNNPKLF